MGPPVFGHMEFRWDMYYIPHLYLFSPVVSLIWAENTEAIWNPCHLVAHLYSDAGWVKMSEMKRFVLLSFESVSVLL